MKFVKYAAIVLLAAGAAPGAATAGFSTMIVFGDSLSDTGNVFAATGSPPAPYFQGHYSNGPVWVEQYAAMLGLPAPTPSLLGGTDYAWGGAETGLTGNSFLSTPNIGTQISGFLAGHALNGSELITLWGGANDFLNAGQTDPRVTVTNLLTEITTLANAGGKTFVVPNLPLLGNLPGTMNLPQAQRDGLNQLTLGYNALLAGGLAQLQNTLGVKIAQVDVAALVASAKANPASYGFSNVTTSAVGDGVVSGNGYLFWDDVHPTTAGHGFVSKIAFAAVPEPSAVALMVSAGVCLAVPGVRGLRRRRAA